MSYGGQTRIGARGGRGVTRLMAYTERPRSAGRYFTLQQSVRRTEKGDSRYAGIKFADRNSNAARWDQNLRELTGTAFGATHASETGKYREYIKPKYPIAEDGDEESFKEQIKLREQRCSVMDRKQIKHDERRSMLHGMIKLSPDESIKITMKEDGQRYNDAIGDVDDPMKLYNYAKKVDRDQAASYNTSYARRVSHRGGRGGSNSRAGREHPNDRRQSKFHGTSGVCWDCGEQGHRCGDAACNRGEGGTDSDSDATSVKIKESKASSGGKETSRTTRAKEDSDDESDAELANRMLINSGCLSSKIIAATTKMLGVKENELLGIDMMSNVSIATNAMYVTNVRQIDNMIEVDTLAGKFRLTHLANWVFGERKRCFFQEGEDINILSTYDYRMQRLSSRRWTDYLWHT
jgi:hypothetical protein